MSYLANMIFLQRIILQHYRVDELQRNLSHGKTVYKQFLDLTQAPKFLSGSITEWEMNAAFIFGIFHVLRLHHNFLPSLFNVQHLCFKAQFFPLREILLAMPLTGLIATTVLVHVLG